MEKKIIELIQKHWKEKPLEIKEITRDAFQENRGSFFIQLRNRKIKAIVLPKRKKIENFIKFCKLLKNKVPKILYNEGNSVFVKWIEGKVYEEGEITPENIKDIAELQAKIHNTKVDYNEKEIIEKVDKYFKANMKYLEDNSKLNKEEIEKLNSFYRKNFPKKLKISLIHGDYHLSNLIETKKGWMSIDNEFYHVFSTGIDIGKALKKICKTDEMRDMYLEAYNKILPVKFYKDNEIFYNMTYLVTTLYVKTKDNKKTTTTRYRLKKLIENLN